MTINSYLQALASQAIARDETKLGIQRSLINLQQRLSAYLGHQLNSDFVFGSYSRGTMLPRTMDPQADVDHMVVFSDSDRRPQTYLDRLQRFAQLQYSRSEVSQSHPTVVLDLNHIRFELVPAVRQPWVNTLRIPAKASDYNDWQDADPTAFNNTLTEANQRNNNLTKPLIRVLKYWNATAGYPFESFDLEKRIVSYPPAYGLASFGPSQHTQLDRYFIAVVDSLNFGFSASPAGWKLEALQRLKTASREANRLQFEGRVEQAESTLARLMP